MSNLIYLKSVFSRAVPTKQTLKKMLAVDAFGFSSTFFLNNDN